MAILIWHRHNKKSPVIGRRLTKHGFPSIHTIFPKIDVNVQIEAPLPTQLLGHDVVLLPLKAGAESQVAVDKGSVAYRRFLQQQGITFGVC